MDAKLRVLSACSVPSVVCYNAKSRKGSQWTQSSLFSVASLFPLWFAITQSFAKDRNGRKAPCSQCLLCSLCGLLLRKVSKRIAQWTQSSVFSAPALFPLWFTLTQSLEKDRNGRKAPCSQCLLCSLCGFTIFEKDRNGRKVFAKDHNGRKAPCSQCLLCSLCGLLLRKVSKRIAMDAKLRVLSASLLCSLCGLLLHKVSKRIAMDAKLRVLSACSVVSVVKHSHHPPLTHRQKSRVQQTFILPLRFNYPPHQRINRTCHN
jgi:hypothetical protein